ncbi:MAG TPA: sugar-binding domain-containing protein, partial [Chloroflexota bacterium]
MTTNESPPRAEHPNPIFSRADWQTLNGLWEFCFDPQNLGEQRRWWAATGPSTPGGPGKAQFDRQITVPFPWESAASGIAEPSYQGVAWYRRTVVIPNDWTARGLQPVLHFGAVDWEARVWLNGRIAGEHRGGYTPFSVDLAPFLVDNAPLTVTLRVRDDCDGATLLGKQVVQWYTHSSGIWQSVWLEGRPADHIAAVALQPHLAEARINAQITVACRHAGDYRLLVSSADGQFGSQEQALSLSAGEQALRLTIPIAQPHAWSPEDPHLYPITVTLRGAADQADTVQTYTGLRDIATGTWEDRPYEYVLLNGEPVYLRLALDQAFHPEGIYSYPSDDAIRADLQIAIDAGLNGLRCHIKINDPRYYYWADRLGLLIMQDIPNPAISTPAAQQAWQDCLHATLA